MNDRLKIKWMRDRESSFIRSKVPKCLASMNNKQQEQQNKESEWFEITIVLIYKTKKTQVVISFDW